MGDGGESSIAAATDDDSGEKQQNRAKFDNAQYAGFLGLYRSAIAPRDEVAEGESR